MQSARGDSLQEGAELGHFLKLIETLWKQGKISGFIYRHHAMSREQLCVPKETSFPLPSKYIDVVRKAKTDLDKI